MGNVSTVRGGSYGRPSKEGPNRTEPRTLTIRTRTEPEPNYRTIGIGEGKEGLDELIKPAHALIFQTASTRPDTLARQAGSTGMKINISPPTRFPIRAQARKRCDLNCRHVLMDHRAKVYARGLPHSKTSLGSNGARSRQPGQRRGLRSRQGLGNLCQEDPPVACRPRKTSARSIVDVFACIRGPASQNWRRPFLKNPGLLRNAVSRGSQTRPCVLVVGHV
jgi:hypothetical protein